MSRPAVRAWFVWLAGGLGHGLAVYVLLLRWVPLEWAYQGSELGIVSVATLARYPAQQEAWYALAAVVGPLAWAGVVAWVGMFASGGREGCGALGLWVSLWWVLFVGWPGKVAAVVWVGGPLVLVMSWALRGQEPEEEHATGNRQPAIRNSEFGQGGGSAGSGGENGALLLAGVGAILGGVGCVLLLGYGAVWRAPAAWGLGGAIAGLGVARWARDADLLGRKAAPLALVATYPYLAPLGVSGWELGLCVAVVTLGAAWGGGLSRRGARALVLGVGMAAVVMDPSTVQRLTLHLRDIDVVDVGYAALAEHGQRLEWVTRWMGGEVPGKDFLYLYGPLMLEMIRASFLVWGKSAAALLFAYHAQDLAGMACVLVCARALLRTRAFAVVTVLGTVPLYLRSGIAGVTLAGLAGEAPLGWLGAGAALGVSALFSQEFAVAQVVAGIAMLALGSGRRRRALAWGGGALVVAGPYVAYLAARGELGPILDTMITYPRLMFAGYSKVPYPSLRAMLPLAAEPGRYVACATDFGRMIVAFYGIPLFYLAGAAYVIARRMARAPVTPRERLMAGLTVYGLVSFRPALGHSCLGHQEALIWPAVLIGAFQMEALACRMRGARLVMLGLVPVLLGVNPAWRRFDEAWRAWENGKVHGSTGLLYEWVPNGGARAGELRAVTLALEESTRPGQPIVCLPNGSVYHFYADRPNPTKYASYALLITRAHRLDAVRAMEARPPACVVYDLATPRLDDLPDRLALDEPLRWVCAHYEVRRQIGSTLLLYPATLSPGQAPRGEVVRFADPLELAVRLSVDAPARPFRLELAP